MATVAPMDNDGIHKFAHGHREVFVDMLRLVAPALEAEFDFDRAEPLPAAYVRPARGRHKQRFGDIAWRAPARRGGADLVVVVEFQSTVKSDMARRMREYGRMARERPTERGGPPALLPVVLYNGSQRWTAPGAFALPESWSPAMQLVLAPFQGWDYVLQSLEQLRSSGGLARLPSDNRAAATLRLQAERMPAELLARFRLEWARFAGDANAGTRRVLHAWTGALLADMDSAESKLPALADLEGLEGETNMATVSQALYAEWLAGVRAQHVAEGIERGIRQGIERGIRQGVERGIKQGVERGIKQGVERGIEQERARGLVRLRRQAAIKFGAGTAERLSAVLAAAGPRAMERVGDRVSDWIVECERGDDLLSRVSALVGNGGAEG